MKLSRTFGDIDAKYSKYGGKENVLIAQPEISQFKIRPDFHDFLILGCQGIFEKLSNQKILDIAWETFQEAKNDVENCDSFH